MQLDSLPSGLLPQLKNTIGGEEIPVWEAVKVFIQNFRSPSPREASGFDLGEGWEGGQSAYGALPSRSQVLAAAGSVKAMTL